MTSGEPVTGERLAVQRMIAADAAAIFRAGIFPVISAAMLRATLGILARTVARGYAGSSGPEFAEHRGDQGA